MNGPEFVQIGPSFPREFAEHVRTCEQCQQLVAGLGEGVTALVRRDDGHAEALIEQPPQQCDLCGKVAELRPYGPNGEAVCMKCAEKDPEAAARGFERYRLGRP